MSGKQFGRRSALSILIFALIVLIEQRQGFAYHDPSTRIVTNTAHTVNEHEFRIGLWRTEFGIFDWWTVGTYHAPWFILAPNIQTKFRIWHGPWWSISAETGFFYVDLGLFLSDSTAQAYMVPIELTGTVDVHKDWSISLGTEWTNVWGSGTIDKDETEGAAAVANLQIFANVEWRIDRIWALVLDGRYLAYKDSTASGITTQRVDDYTTVEINGAADANDDDIQHAYSLTLAAVASWQTFNLRFGVGWGNFNVPGLNVVVPDKIPYPALDLYWRF